MKKNDKKKLAFILPTSNRPASISYYLEKQIDAFSSCKIDVIVFDSSDTDETKQIVERYQKQGISNLIYHFFVEKEIDKRAIDRKVYTACKLYAAQYEYLWFSSDSTVFDIVSLWNELEFAMNEKLDYIVWNHIQEKHPKERYYNDSRFFLLEYSWVMTLLGANVISSKCLLEAVHQFPVSNGDDFSFWIPLAIFHLFSERKINAKVLGHPLPYAMNPARGDPFWKQSGDTLWQWAKVWPEAVDALPCYYNEIKENIIRSQEKHMKMFTFKSLLSMRASGQIHLQDVIKYRTNISRVSKTPIWCFYLITILGNRKLLTMIKKVYKSMKLRGEEK